MITPVSSMLWVIFGSFIGSLGAAALKAGAKRLKLDVVALLTNWQLVAGVAAYLISSVFFVFGLREGELSILYPLVSLGYLWTLVWSKIFFGETITRMKLIGVGLVLVGVALLGLGTRTEEAGADVAAAQQQHDVFVPVLVR